MNTVTTTRSIDRTGKTISTFVVFDIVTELAKMIEGETIEVLIDDFPALRYDIAAWCEIMGHPLDADEAAAEKRRLLIRRGPEVVRDTSLAMVISTAGLEELLSPLGFALAAALEGIHVHLFVQGPAVRVLVRGYQPKLAGWSRPFTRFAAAGMAKTGHSAAQDKLRQLQALGGRIYLCGPSMDHFKVQAEDLVFDDLPEVEYLTFMGLMERADIHIYT